jgi:two-component system nitrogen regulation response regulator GlnG
MQSKQFDEAPRDDAQPKAVAKPASFRTLVVDADHFMSAALEQALTADGQLILTADSAKSALDLTRQFQPDLILLDSGIEGAQNLELLGELLIEQASAAVVVVARNASVREAVEAMKMGALDYLERPLDPKKIAEVCSTQQAWFKDA